MITQGPFYILVVEDNPGDFALVEELLAEQPIAPVVEHARNFFEARALLVAGHSFNIVLLDLSLPDHSGAPLIHDMVALCGNVPVIVLTGYLDFGFGVRSLSMGVSDYLLKDELTAIALQKSVIYSTERKKINLALEASEKRVRSFAKLLNKMLEEERARIAREIHDEFGQQLSGLKMSLSALKKTNGATRENELLIDMLVADVNASIASVRRIANELRPALLDKLGLFPALQWLSTEFMRKTGITCTYSQSLQQPKSGDTTEINIFRICQEALTNISKHAQATRVDMNVTEGPGQWYLTITDNGVGIRPGTRGNPLAMGLLNMQERAQMVGAALDIQSSDRGTIIKLVINSHA